MIVDTEPTCSKWGLAVVQYYGSTPHLKSEMLGTRADTWSEKSFNRCVNYAVPFLAGGIDGEDSEAVFSGP